MPHDASRPIALRRTRGLFLALLGVVHLLAFASFAVQAEGLIGSEGIRPVDPTLQYAREVYGGDAYRRLPTLLWLDDSDASLRALCAAGVALSILLVLGVAPGPVLLGLFVAYESLASVGDRFMSYQWDVLLLETSAIALLLAPWTLRPAAARRAPLRRGAVWLLRWLLFRLVFLSGFVKLASGDESWRHLTALQFHYFTQPLPAWTSWYAHWLPDRVHELSVLATFAIELGAPLLIFGPRRMRLVACGAISLLMLLIALTGNYGFFNLLTVALCVTLLDDDALRTLTPRALRSRPADPPPPSPSLWRAARELVFGAACLLMAGMSLFVFLYRVGVRLPLPRPAAKVVRWATSLRAVGSYGLFAVMTTHRDEIVFSGSRDGTTWREYEFRWKPGALDRAPPFVQPHMPRLDWTLWFAALGTCEQNRWVLDLQQRLLEGSPAVTRLLARDPFPEGPPRYLRTQRYRYEFSEPGEPGVWWRRTLRGDYCPTVTLRHGALAPADSLSPVPRAPR